MKYGIRWGHNQLEMWDRESIRSGCVIIESMKYWLRRLSHPIRGLKYAITKDSAVSIEFYLFGIFGIPLTLYFLSPLTNSEILLVIFFWFFLLVTETLNSALETALKKIHPENDEAIGRSKDLASAAVMLAFIFGIICIICISQNII